MIVSQLGYKYKNPPMYDYRCFNDDSNWDRKLHTKDSKWMFAGEAKNKPIFFSTIFVKFYLIPEVVPAALEWKKIGKQFGNTYRLVKGKIKNIHKFCKFPIKLFPWGHYVSSRTLRPIKDIMDHLGHYLMSLNESYIYWWTESTFYINRYHIPSFIWPHWVKIFKSRKLTIILFIRVYKQSW